MSLTIGSPKTTPTRDSSGRFVKQECKTPEDPPLVSLEVTNPVTFIKKWWKKIVGNEGIEIKFKAKPLTTVAIVLVLIGASMGLEKIFTPFGIISNQIFTPVPTATTDPWKETALSGILRKTPNTSKYYLQTESVEAVSIEFPFDINLDNYVGKRILASGKYNSKTKVIIISDIIDLEVLPKSPVPVITPTASPIPTPTIESTPTPRQTPTISSLPEIVN